MLYILPSRAMTKLFNSVNFVYRSVEVYLRGHTGHETIKNMKSKNVVFTRYML